MRKVQEMREKAKLQLQQLSAADPEVGKDKSGKAKIWGRKHYGGIIISDETPTTIFNDDETEVDPGGPIREMLMQGFSSIFLSLFSSSPFYKTRIFHCLLLKIIF